MMQCTSCENCHILIITNSSIDPRYIPRLAGAADLHEGVPRGLACSSNRSQFGKVRECLTNDTVEMYRATGQVGKKPPVDLVPTILAASRPLLKLPTAQAG